MARNAPMTHSLKLVVVLLAAMVLTGLMTACKQPTAAGDTTSPTVTVTSTTSDPTGVSPIDVSIVFSEVVTGFDQTDLVPANATIEALSFTTADDTTFTLNLIPDAAELTVTLDIAADVCTDAAGNPNTAATQFSRFYTARPVPTISSTSADPTNVSPIPITITFNKAVENFDENDFTLTNCLISIPSSSDGGFVWTADLTPGEGLVQATVPDGVCDEAGASTVTNIASNTFSITYDTTSPGILTMTSPAGPTNTPYSLDITFSEAVDPATFTGADITFTAGTGSASDPTTSDNITWTSTITPTSQGTVTVTINAAVVKDLAGNDNTAAPGSASTTWDTVQPGVTSITSTTSATTGAHIIPCTVLFSEAVNPASFDETDITVGGTAAGRQVEAGSLATSENITWTFNLIYTGAGTITATINAGAVSDPAGNTNTAPAAPLSRTIVTALTFHDAVSARGSGGLTITAANINAGGSTNPIAIIGVTAEKTSAIDITDVTYAGTSATPIPGSKVTYNNGSYWIVTALYQIVPASGNKDVVATFTAAPDEGKVGCIILNYANQTSPIGAVQTQDIAGPTGTNYVLSTSITSTYYYSMLVDMFGGSDATAATATAGQTSRWQQVTTNACGGSSTKPLTAPGDATVGWTLTLDQVTRLQHAVAEVRIVQ